MDNTGPAEIVALAREWCFTAHDGQVDRAGCPYAFHPQRVAEAVAARLGADHPAVAVGWLHDVVEDTEVTVAQIEEVFGPDIAAAVDAVSKRRGEHVDDYYARVLANEWAYAVKIADVADNSKEDRLEYLPHELADRLRKKYAHAREVLGIE